MTIATRPKVVYVMGAGRSGSTILGVALGNCDGVFFAGELDKWLARSGTPRREGQELARFWAQVRDDVDDVQELFAARTGWLERSSALLDPRKWPERRRLRRGYRRASQDLYLAIARAAQTQQIVDTSHYPLRARELQALDGVELYLLYLVRDPQSVVASLGRRDVVERRFGVAASNAYLWLTHLLASITFLRHRSDRRLLVRHEDFLADPARVLRRILDMIGSASPLPELDSLHTGVPFHGNRLVQSEVVALDSRASVATRRSYLTAIAQAPWRLVFSRLRPDANG
jgi:hypothetical protein